MSSPSLAAKPLAGDSDGTSDSASRSWSEKDEVRLLRAVLEIAEESAESFDPAVSPFDRIGKNLKPPFRRPEILAKVKELRRSYEEKCYKIRIGGVVGAYNSAAFEISNKIWGEGVGVGIKENKNKNNNKKKKGKKNKNRRKKKKNIMRIGV